MNSKPVSVPPISRLWFWLLLFFTFVFLTLNRHSKSRLFEYHSEIWADKAGYYIYLPATFLQHWDAVQLPDSISVKTGNGFSIDSLHSRITTKYTYGVSLCESPAFGGAYLYEVMHNHNPSGFERSFAYAIDISAVIFLTLGLFILFKILSKSIESKKAILCSLALLLSTNLYYYGICETGMSHVYSFFAFVLLIFSFENWLLHQRKFNLFLIGISCGLILVIRPINALFIFILPLLSIAEKKANWKNILQLLGSIYVIIPVVLLILPQLLYWHYLTGSLFHYSYTNEGFDNLSHPAIVEFLFSTNNGLFTYTPLWLVILVSLWFSKKLKHKIKVSYTFAFLIIVFLFASWWSWNYGCGYGSRTMVEYSSVFYIMVARNLEFQRKSTPLYILITLLIFINMKTIYSYDGCWYAGDWDFLELFQLVTGPTK